ncbi:MAG: MarR family transcriptional regulator [Bauldia sp.]|nr:MarR family transcriptional regulator [Bauldia sp.]
MDSEQASAFIDQHGLFWDRVGGNRTMGRILAWLMICNPPEQSAPDIVAALDVSKASVSTAMRGLETARLIERVARPGSRRVHFRLPPGGWDVVARRRVEEAANLIVIAEKGVAAVADEPPGHQERIRDYLEWLTWWRRAQEDLLRGRPKGERK